MEERTYASMCEQIHESACQNEELSYIDPQTGFQVFTRLYLKKRPCCKSGCRHCPYGFIGTEKKEA